MEAGRIEILMEGVSFEETKRLREVIHTLLANGSLSLRNGCVKIYYDSNAIPQKIEHDFIKYSRKHSQT